MYAHPVPTSYHYDSPLPINEARHTPHRPHELTRDAHTPAGYLLVYQSPRQYQPFAQHHFSPASIPPSRKRHIQGGHITGARVITPILTEFPSTFKPRTDPNMSHKEKVSSWISELPVFPITSTAMGTSCEALFQGDWHNECYPGVVSSASSVSQFEALNDLAFQESATDGDGHYNYVWSTQEYSHSMNTPASGNRTMLNPMKNPVHLVFGKDQLFVEREDVREYQTHKVTRYVRRMYRMDNSEQVRKGPQPDITYNVLHSSYNGISGSSPAEYDFQEVGLFESEADPYMNKRGFKSQEHIMLTLREYKTIKEQADRVSRSSHVPILPALPPPPAPSRKSKKLSLNESIKVKSNVKTSLIGEQVQGPIQDADTSDAFELMAKCDLKQAQHISSRASQAMRAQFDFHSPLQGFAMGSPVVSPVATRVVHSPPIAGKKAPYMADTDSG